MNAWPYKPDGKMDLKRESDCSLLLTSPTKILINWLRVNSNVQSQHYVLNNVRIIPKMDEIIYPKLQSAGYKFCLLKGYYLILRGINRSLNAHHFEHVTDTAKSYRDSLRDTFIPIKGKLTPEVRYSYSPSR